MAVIVVKRGESIWDTDCAGIVLLSDTKGRMSKDAKAAMRERYPVAYARHIAQCDEHMWSSGMVSAMKVKEGNKEPGRVILIAYLEGHTSLQQYVADQRMCLQRLAFIQDKHNYGLPSIALPPIGDDGEQFADYVSEAYRNAPVCFHIYL